MTQTHTTRHITLPFLYLDTHLVHTHKHTCISMSTQIHRAVHTHGLLSPYSEGKEDTSVPSRELKCQLAQQGLGKFYDSMGSRGFPAGPSTEEDPAGRMEEISH